MPLLNLCSTIEASFKEELQFADDLTDYAVELRYPDDWYEPSVEETKAAYKSAVTVREFVLSKIKKIRLC